MPDASKISGPVLCWHSSRVVARWVAPTFIWHTWLSMQLVPCLQSYYERLQEWSKQEAGSSQPDAAADEADAATAAAAAPAAMPAEAPYKPTLLLGAAGQPATDDSVAFFDVMEEMQ